MEGGEASGGGGGEEGAQRRLRDGGARARSIIVMAGLKSAVYRYPSVVE